MSYQENSVDFLKSYLKGQTEINKAQKDIYNFECVYWEARTEHTKAVNQLVREHNEMEVKLYQKVDPLLSSGYDMECDPGMCLGIMYCIETKFNGMKEELLKFREKFQSAIAVVKELTLQNPISASFSITREDLAKMVIEDRMELVKSYEEKAKSANNWEAVLKDQLGDLDWEKAKAEMNAKIEECIELIKVLCGPINS